MKIAITARGKEPENEVDEAFGRAYWFLIFDLETNKWNVLDNARNRNATENAGVHAVKLLVQQGVRTVITGETGPKAFRALQAAEIAVFHGAFGSVVETFQAWRDGRLQAAAAANAPGSPSCLVGRTALPITMGAVRVTVSKEHRS